MKAKIKSTSQIIEVETIYDENSIGNIHFLDTNNNKYFLQELDFIDADSEEESKDYNNSNEIMERTAYFKSEKWLNKEISPSTGSIVCFDGDVEYTEGVEPCMFIEIADCHSKVRLHKSHTDTTKEFIDKIDLMINALERYRDHLIYESPHKPTERK